MGHGNPGGRTLSVPEAALQSIMGFRGRPPWAQYHVLDVLHLAHFSSFLSLFPLTYKDNSMSLMGIVARPQDNNRVHRPGMR